MSIVEKAADRMRQSERQNPHQVRRVPHKLREEDRPTTPERIGSADEHQPAPEADVSERLHVDFRALRRAGLLPPDTMTSQLTREYQRIKRPLLTGSGEKSLAAETVHSNLVMVASAQPREGKTFTSFNLALSLARERDHSVLLVDGDVIKPAISRALGLTDHIGLSDLLTNEDLSVGDATVTTDISGLSVLPAGRAEDDMAELLSSRRMKRLVEQMGSDSSTIVVFDSSPLLATAESQALAMHVGQVLLVVKAGVTERRAIESALTLVESPECTISLVLNQSQKAHGDDYAGYYGRYYGDDNASV